MYTLKSVKCFTGELQTDRGIFQTLSATASSPSQRRPLRDLRCFIAFCRAEAEAGANNEEPDGHGSADPCPGSAEVTRGPSSV